MKRILSAAMAALLLVTLLIPCASAEESKKEMVYVIADAAGTPTSITVSEHLMNPDGEDTLTDYSRLTDIENMGGDETFENTDGTLVWDASGDEIRYEGTSTEPLPVSVSLRYTLDGQEISPEELSGKSGHLVIDITYTANHYEDCTIGGETVSLPLPFLMATIMLADDETFSNLEITNGKVVNIGDRTLALCYGLPGLSEALNLAEYEDRINEDASGVEEETDGSVAVHLDASIPTTASISADVTDFHFDGTYTAALCSFFSNTSDNETTITFDTEALGEQLSSAMSELLDGSQQLSDGAVTLSDGLAELVANNDALVSGANQIAEAILETANEGLAAKQADLAKLGIEVHTLTADNYAEELTRLEKEYLENIEPYVYKQADATLASTVNTAVYNEVVKQVNAAAQTQVSEKVSAAVEEQVRAKVEAAVREQVTEKVTESVRAQVSTSVTSAVRAQVESGVRAAYGDAATEEQISAAVEQEMASAEVASQIESAVEAQMSSSDIQQTISTNAEAQMSSDTVQATIEQNCQAQMSSDTVKQTIEENTTEQMNSDSTKELIDQNVESQMASENVKSIISEKIASNRSGSSYTQSVAQALEENGENGAAYQSLVQLKESLDGVFTFCQGVADYTDGVSQASSGAKELSDGMAELNEGLQKLNEQLAQKLIDFLDIDLPEVSDRLQAVADMAESYISYAGIAEGATGSVHFLIRTAAVQ